MKRFFVTTLSITVAMVLSIIIADFAGFIPVEQPTVICPDGARPVSGIVHYKIIDTDFQNLSCRDAEGRPHGPNFNWSDGHLAGMSFWKHGERVGSTLAFYEFGRIWIAKDDTAAAPFSVAWAESGLKESEEVERGEVRSRTTWHTNGKLKSQSHWAGESDPYVLADGSWNEGRKDESHVVGEWRSYHENGNPKDVGSYQDGVRDGEWVCSDESGELIVRATFSGGRLISRTGDVDAESMKYRCRESSCGGASSGGSRVAAEGGISKTSGGCAAGVS